MSRVALFFIVDQLRVREAIQLCGELRPARPARMPALGVAQCGYIPVVTPVGHATLATGRNPGDHGVRGRRWNDASGACSIDDVTRAFELAGGVAGIRSRAPLRSDCTKATASVLFDNVLAAPGIWQAKPRRTTTVAIAAKDFVAVTLAGVHADVVIYPRIYPNPARVALDELVPIEVRVHVATSAMLDARLVGRIRHLLRDLVDSFRDATGGALDRSLKLRIVNSLGYVADGLCHKFLLSIPGTFLETDSNAIAIDRFYAAIAKELIATYITHGDVFVLQSLYSADYIAHACGPGDARYRIAVQQLFHIIRDVIQSAVAETTTRYGNTTFCITSDHGGRSIGGELHLTKTRDGTFLGDFPIPLFPRVADYYHEDAIVSAAAPTRYPTDTAAIARSADGLFHWRPLDAVVRASFGSHRVRLVVAPLGEAIFLRTDAPVPGRTGGAHGGGVWNTDVDLPWGHGDHPLGVPNGSAVTVVNMPALRSGMQLSPEEQYVPVLLGTDNVQLTEQELSQHLLRCTEQRRIAETFRTFVEVASS